MSKKPTINEAFLKANSEYVLPAAPAKPFTAQERAAIDAAKKKNRNLGNQSIGL